MAEMVIKLENVSKKFGNFFAVKNVNLTVHKGETVGLVGPNGAGKTTTIKMIARLLRPNEGKILLRNNQNKLQDLHKSPRNLNRLGFLIDIPAFYNMTAYDLLKYYAKLQKYPKEKIEERINELLHLFKLIDWKYKKVKTFSKGMAQKLGIIQAIIHDPEIIILDEPQTGLDPKARIEIRKFLRELQNQGKTILVASHMLYEISEICDKVALINRGNIIAFDTIENLERNLKTKELKCQILNPIPPENLSTILERMSEKLNPYLDKNLDVSVSKIPIKYDPYEQGFRIFYNGDQISVGEILKILVKDFEHEFTIISFTQSKTSQLERIYSEMIKDTSEDNHIRRR